MNNVSINLWAVLAAAAANMVIGSLWYGPVFGKQWKRLMGFTDESMKSMKMSAMKAMFGGVATALVSAYILAHFVGYMGVFDVAGAVQLAFWLWLGFIATTQFGSVLWEGRSFKLFSLNAAESLVAIAAMTIIIALM